jgi:hypothetical protein
MKQLTKRSHLLILAQLAILTSVLLPVAAQQARPARSFYTRYFNFRYFSPRVRRPRPVAPAPTPTPTPATPPVTANPPATPPVTPPVDNASNPPATPPVAGNPPVTPPVTPPVDNAGNPPATPPVTPPVDNAGNPPATPPVTPPVDNAGNPPATPPVAGNPPVTPPVTPPIDNAGNPPATPPVAGNPPVTPPVDNAGNPPATPPVTPPIDNAGNPPATPPVAGNPPVTPPVDNAGNPPATPPTPAPVAEINTNCTLIVPARPLTAKGLATPYQFTATDPAAGPCNESNIDQGAFVEAAIFDPATGQVSIYNPLVIDRGQTPARPPVVPFLPRNARVALWFGSNADGKLTLQGTDNLASSGCVNGGPGGASDVFGQVAFCNAPRFFRAAQRAINLGQLQVPPLGTGKDGQPCPTVRDFSVVDQDQSDNVLTSYIQAADGRLAQDTVANRAALPGATTLRNASDNRVVAVGMANALGCTPWKAASLTDPGQTVPSQALNELFARARQARPIARVPSGHPFVLSDGKENLEKLNAFRRGVAQFQVTSLAQADTTRYCRNLFRIAPAKFKKDEALFRAEPTPRATVANSFFTFLAQRFVGSDEVLQCSAKLGMTNPVTITNDANGVTIDAQINLASDARNQAILAPTAPADAQKAVMEVQMDKAAVAADAAAAPADPAPIADPNAVTPQAAAPAAPNAVTPPAAAPVAPNAVTPPVAAPADPNAVTPPAAAPVAPNAVTPPVAAPVDPNAVTPPAATPVDPNAVTPPAAAPADPNAVTPPVAAPVDPNAVTPPAAAPADPNAVTPPAAAPADPKAATPPAAKQADVAMPTPAGQ